MIEVHSAPEKSILGPSVERKQLPIVRALSIHGSNQHARADVGGSEPSWRLQTLASVHPASGSDNSWKAWQARREVGRWAHVVWV
jgi:hypothetical protein